MLVAGSGKCVPVPVFRGFAPPIAGIERESRSSKKAVLDGIGTSHTISFKQYTLRI